MFFSCLYDVYHNFVYFLPLPSLLSLFTSHISHVGRSNLYLSMPYLCLSCVDTKYFHLSSESEWQKPKVPKPFS